MKKIIEVAALMIQALPMRKIAEELTLSANRAKRAGIVLPLNRHR
ncbi:MAG: hypothetical protein ACXVIS_07230 [Halobacteriota archaeon]